MVILQHVIIKEIVKFIFINFPDGTRQDRDGRTDTEGSKKMWIKELGMDIVG